MGCLAAARSPYFASKSGLAISSGDAVSGFSAFQRIAAVMRVRPLGWSKKMNSSSGTGIEFAIFAQQHIDVGFAIGLAGGVQAVHVGFKFHGARDAVGHRRHEKEVEREHDHRQRQYGDVRDPADIPSLSPAREREVDSPVQEGESRSR